MKIVIKGTNLELTGAIKSYAEAKVAALERFFGEILEARIEVEHIIHSEKGHFRCEVNLDVPQTHVMRAESVSPDLYAAIDEVIPKLREQIEKFKGRHEHQDRKLRRYMKSMFAWRPWRKTGE